MIAALIAALALDGAAEVAKLEWMAGSWVSERDGVVVRETWLAPRDGAMAGAAQTNQPGRKPSIEFTRITAEPAGVTFTAIVGSQPPTPFVLKPGADGEAVFENLAHDFPQRVIYRRCGADLCARVEGQVKGKLQGDEWRYTRIKP
ncbi:DUF6265 family protein [Phenylobacterium sp.]|jgi:hypothetical protein|uniref:DUF6265 family protein n=1 Tax=Phenylobacterium sp. TaxID=1871053 RepID=UPI002F955FBE